MSRRLKILIGIAVGISVIGAVLCLGLHLNIKGILRSTQRTVIAGDYIQRMTQRANEGDPLAMFSLSLAYRKGKLVPKNERIAFDWLTKAADAGDVNAQNNLGAEYQFGGLVAKDIRRAFHWYEKASAQGHPTAQFNLARLHLFGEGVPKNEEAAFALFTRASNAGHADAANYLGTMYLNGSGVKVDKTKALEWFEYSVKNGNPHAQYNLARMLRNGDGVAPDYQRAMALYEEAANNGVTDALLGMAAMYLKELGVEKDRVKVGDLYRQASDRGVSDATAFIESHFTSCISDIVRDEERANSCLIAAGAGYAQAQVRVGDAYRNGMVFPKDDVKAVEWFTKAASQGNMAGHAMLGMAYFQGQGVTKDRIEGHARLIAARQIPATNDWWERSLTVQIASLMDKQRSEMTKQDIERALKRSADILKNRGDSMSQTED